MIIVKGLSRGNVGATNGADTRNDGRIQVNDGRGWVDPLQGYLDVRLGVDENAAAVDIHAVDGVFMGHASDLCGGNGDKLEIVVTCELNFVFSG